MEYTEENVACVIVTYNPDLHVLARVLDALPVNASIVLVDNASGSAVLKELTRLLKNRKRSLILTNEQNHGLAFAINQGVRAANNAWPNIHFVLLLDQDSEPLSGSVSRLVQAFEYLISKGQRVGCVGPALLDVTTGLYHGFHQCTHWRWRRIYPSEGDVEPVSCANLNGSGTLTPIKLFLELGGLDEDFFIDHVDTEWSFRVLSAGYSLWGIPGAKFVHRMGEQGIRFWFFGWHVWPARSPLRHYFLFRNAITLMKRNYVPRVWKFWAIIKLMLTMTIHALLDSQRVEQIRCMWRGLKEGIYFKRPPPAS